jgi:chromosome partitioning protein
MLITVATEKGGVGKTTIATNLAAMRAGHGDSVKLIDTDDGKYAYQWGMTRREAQLVPEILLAMMEGNIYADLIDERSKHDTVIVDVPAGDGPTLRLACAAADVIIIPLRIGQFDTRSLGKTSHIANEIRQTRPNVRIFAVLNAVPFNAKTGLAESIAVLDEMTDYFTRVKKHIVDREAFRLAARSGKGVTEIERKFADPKAIEEMTSLYEEVFNV